MGTADVTCMYDLLAAFNGLKYLAVDTAMCVGNDRHTIGG
jgi:hypothetical protein